MNAVLADTARGQVIHGLPAEEYHRREIGVASSGVLKMLRIKTPAHLRAWYESEGEDDTPALAFGRAYHMRVLEPERFAETYITAPEDPPRRPTRAQRDAKKPSQDTLDAIAWWDAWESENAGRVVLSAGTFEQIEAMHAALLLNPLVAGLLRDGDAEVTLRWTDEATGVACKARADWHVPARAIFADLKTTEDASPAAFARAVERYGYHIQHAHYAQGARACGIPLKNYLIVAQEKEAPYLSAVYQIDAHAEARGFELCARGMQTLAACTASNDWPGYTGITELSLPAWALKD